MTRPVRVAVHGALRRVLEDPVARLARTIEADLGRSRADRPTSRWELDGPHGINPSLLLHRLWVGAYHGDGPGRTKYDAVDVPLREAHLRAVATACHRVRAELLAGLDARRRAAAVALADRTPGWVWRALLIAPMGRLVIGHGEDSVHETSLTLSPTYGVPVLPGTALKGLAAATARDRETGWTDQDTELFGSPARQGEVLVWDGLPIDQPQLVLDVLTPHVKDYYDEGNSSGGPPETPPAEYHNPVPVRFLAVHKTRFRVYVLGPRDAVGDFLRLLRTGLDDLGIGAKTAAGYGYCLAREEGPGWREEGPGRREEGSG